MFPCKLICTRSFFWLAFGPKSLETDQALDYGGKEDLVVST